MRKITAESVEAFINMWDYKKDNTEVKTYSDCITKMFLHWNFIAEYNQRENKLWISNDSYYTNTTKERLNGILESLTYYKLKQIKWVWYLISDNEKIQFNWEYLFNNI